MRPVLVAVLLFPVFLLAGCVDGDESASDPVVTDGTQETATPTPDITAPPADDDGVANETAASVPGPGYAFGCQAQAAVIPVPADQVAQYMPTGFEPTPYGGAAPGMAGGLMFGNQCTNATLDGTAVTGWREALVAILVEPPAELADDAVEEDYLLLGMATAGPYVEAYRRIGIPAEPVDTFAMTGVDAGEAATGTLLGSAGGMDFTIRSSVASEGEVEPFVVRFIGVQNGTAMGAVTFTLQDAPVQYVGPASVEMTGETFFGTGAATGLAVHYSWPDDGFTARQVFTAFGADAE